MAATVWKGHLTFGLVSIPVKLHRAARAEKVTFRQLHAAGSARVRQVYVREDAELPLEPPVFEAEEAEEEAPPARASFRAPVPIRGKGPVTVVPEPPPPPPLPIVERSELVKGYEYAKGQYVTISKEDLANITPDTAREMQILEFVKLADVDPICFETSYYVTPDRAGERAYALLLEALRRSGYVAVAQFAMHNREHVVIIRPGRTGIILHTMFYETEIRRDDEYRTDTSSVGGRELDMALLLIENLAAPFEPSKYRDSYKEKLDALIAAKIEGTETVEPRKPAAKPAADILAALERSLAMTRKPASSEGTAPAKRKRAK